MESEKRKIPEPDFEECDGYTVWGLMLQWFLVLLLVAAIVVVILVIMGPSIGNIFSDIPCGCLMDKGITVAMQ